MLRSLRHILSMPQVAPAVDAMVCINAEPERSSAPLRAPNFLGRWTRRASSARNLIFAASPCTSIIDTTATA
jgi:hypothetical protein